MHRELEYARASAAVKRKLRSRWLADAEIRNLRGRQRGSGRMRESGGGKAGSTPAHVPLSKSFAALAARARRITRKKHGQETTAKVPREESH